MFCIVNLSFIRKGGPVAVLSIHKINKNITRQVTFKMKKFMIKYLSKF